jgi:hypothetical protein
VLAPTSLADPSRSAEISAANVTGLLITPTRRTAYEIAATQCGISFGSVSCGTG